MAHWAQIDENNTVLQVTVGDNNSPDLGYQWLIDNLGGTWIQTSYSSYGGKKYNVETNEPTDEFGFRYNYAGIGFSYDYVLDAFVPPKPPDYINDQGQLVTYVLNETTCLWEPVVVD